jgi:spermidine/putrescine-binding protein
MIHLYRPLPTIELAVIVLLAMQGCSNVGDSSSGASTAPRGLGPVNSKGSEQPFAGQTLNVFNWSDYIDQSLIYQFEQRTGAKIQYDNYSSDAELETKLLTGDTDYDVVFPSDRSMTPLIGKGKLAELDKSLLPNLRNIDPKFLHPRFDIENRHSVPYFWGTAAVGIRTDKVAGPVMGFEALFDQRYRGHITMLDDPENVVALTLIHLGLPMNSTADADLSRARDLLVKQKTLIQAYTSDAYKEKLINGEAWVALGWSGDLLQARKEQPKIRVIIPQGGTMIWLDNIAIPSGARNVRLAHAFIDFLMEPEVAARNANAVQYPTPNASARALVDRQLLEDPAVYPPPQVLERCDWLQDRGAAIAKIEQVWQQVK